MELATHAALERRINHLVLLHPCLAGEGGGDHGGGVMVAVAAQVVNADLGVGQSLTDHGFDLGGIHCHRVIPLIPLYFTTHRPYSAAASPHGSDRKSVVSGKSVSVSVDLGGRRIIKKKK